MRAELPPRRHRLDRDTVIPGLSSAAIGEVRRVEREKKYLLWGEVGEAFACWERFMHSPARRLLPRYRGELCDEFRCCFDPWQSREYLEAVMRSMSRRRARELRRIVDALDREY
jgi:hypothetical protein